MQAAAALRASVPRPECPPLGNPAVWANLTDIGVSRLNRTRVTLFGGLHSLPGRLIS